MNIISSLSKLIQEDPGVHWPVSLAYLINSKLVRDSASKKTWKVGTLKSEAVTLPHVCGYRHTSTCMWIQACTHVYTHTNTYMHTCIKGLTENRVCILHTICS